MDYLGSSDDFGLRDVVAGEAPDSILSLMSQDFLDQGSIFAPSDIEEDQPDRKPEESFNFVGVGSDLNLGAFGDAAGSDVSPASSVTDFYDEAPFFSDIHTSVDIKEETTTTDCPEAFTEVVLAPGSSSIDGDDYCDYVYDSESDRTVYVDKIRRPSESSSSSSSSVAPSDDDLELSPLSDLPLSFCVVAKGETAAAPAEVKKPRMSYAQLIAEALMNAVNRRLTLSEIYVHINARHPFYSLKGGKNWQNAIRHNLTLNKSFVKVPRPANEGRGSYWELEAGAEKAIFKRLLRQHYMYKVALDGGRRTARPSAFSLGKKAARPTTKSPLSLTSKFPAPAGGGGSKSKPQIKIIRSVPLSTKAALPKVSAAVSSSSSTKPTVIYVTLPKILT